MSAPPEQSWMPGDVYFGDAQKPLPDWRAEASESDTDDDAPLSEEERKALVGMLGFDPAELFGEDAAETATMESLLLESGFTGTDSHGHHWVSGKQVAVNKDQPNQPQEASENDPAVKSWLGKAAERINTAVTRTVLAVQQKVSALAVKVGAASVVEDLLDTIPDTQRLIYASGKAQPHPLASMGVPLSAGQLVVIGSHVLGRVALAIRKKLGMKSLAPKPAQESLCEANEGKDGSHVVDMLTDILDSIREEFAELKDVLPDRAAVEEMIAKRAAKPPAE